MMKVPRKTFIRRMIKNVLAKKYTGTGLGFSRVEIIMLTFHEKDGF